MRPTPAEARLLTSAEPEHRPNPWRWPLWREPVRVSERMAFEGRDVVLRVLYSSPRGVPLAQERGPR